MLILIARLQQQRLNELFDVDVLFPMKDQLVVLSLFAVAAM